MINNEAVPQVEGRFWPLASCSRAAQLERTCCDRAASILNG
jgi:hypothetical protein